VPAPRGANRLVQLGSSEQALQLRRKLLEASLEVATGVASEPGSPVLLVCVLVAGRDRQELATQALGPFSQIRGLTARHRPTALDSRSVPDDREATVAARLAVLVPPAQERREEEDREHR
jgi:hypothetical protein